MHKFQYRHTTLNFLTCVNLHIIEKLILILWFSNHGPENLRNAKYSETFSAYTPIVCLGSLRPENLENSNHSDTFGAYAIVLWLTHPRPENVGYPDYATMILLSWKLNYF